MATIPFSLGLISDSFHMFFDCTALLAGLVASLIARWRPNNKYPYGSVSLLNKFTTSPYL